MRDEDRERADACSSFKTRLCLYIDLFGQESVAELTSSEIFVDLSAFSSRVLHQTVQSTNQEE